MTSHHRVLYELWRWVESVCLGRALHHACARDDLDAVREIRDMAKVQLRPSEPSLGDLILAGRARRFEQFTDRELRELFAALEPAAAHHGLRRNLLGEVYAEMGDRG